MKKSGNDNNYVTSMEFTNALNKYIPSLVLQQWITKIDQQQIQLPELQPTETVVLFADISGFTMISEACALMGVRGNEELAFCINRYMEGMVKSLGKYGGDIIKFVGDAMIVMWPRFNTNDANNNGSSSSPKTTGGDKLFNRADSKQVMFKDQMDDRVTVVRKAIQCAIDIQNELNNKKIMSNVTNLSVKIGIGFGQCALLYVGGVFNRSEFFTVGDALTQALKSEENATAGGQIIVSSNAWGLVKDFFKSEEIISDHGGKFYRISGLVQGIRTRADAVLLRNLIQADNFARIQNKLKSCIPAAIMPYLEIGYEQYGSETRRLTVMFASLGVDLSSAQTEAGMKKIQKIVTTVQQQVYRLEGSLNKLVMDDKGSTLICIWGLCPFSHEDDAARAILTAINMRRELAKIDNTWCNVGISTGEVFSGVVGTSGSRKEFSVLGDYVNLAARIMYWPKKYKQTGKIHVDLQTKKEADNFIKFNYKGHQEFKGKSISLPIFEPVDPEEEMQQCLKKVVPYDVFLKIHSNPFIIDRGSEFKRKHCKQIGREKLLHKVCDEIMDFFDSERQENSRPYFLAIMGEIGSGKTLFARCIYDQLKKRKDFLRDDVMGSDFKPILTSALNAESQMKFLNIWRPILQSMMFIHCKKNNLYPDKIINRLMKNVQDEKYDIILDIFNLGDLKKNGLYLPLPEDPIQFVKREKYSEDIVDSVLDFIIEFIKEVLGERDDYYSDIDQSQLSDDERSRMSHMKNQYMFAENPMIAILDTVYLMDEASWRLLELIKDECSQIAVILLMQTDTNNQAKIHHEARQFYQDTFGNHLELFRIVDLPPFKIEELNQLLQELSSKYQSSMSEEINLMTLIDDPEHSIKDPEVCKIKEKELKKKHLVSENFSFISEEVLETTLQRCEGNPMICMNFIFSLISNDFLIIKDSSLQPSNLFKKCKQRQDWSTVPVPGITQKINTSLIDSFIKDLRSKMNKTDAENAVKGVLLLKSAAVIGEVFGSKILQSISPLRNETHKSILQVLKILEQKDFIEILDETDQKNVQCRFRKCFLRETIYQIMLYRAQKKGLHQLMVQYIQNNPNSFDNDPEQEAEKLLNHILLAEDLDSEDKVPFKSKQGLIVKKIANKLMKNPNVVVKSGYLTKQGDKPNKKVEKRLMVIKAKELSWYHNEKEFKAGKPLGVIYMSSIYHCVPANTAKSTDDLNIGTCAWRKKEIEKEGKREFIFGAKDEQERDEWISCIEYLRAKAIYDNFTQKFCNITFPMRRPSEDIQTDQREYILSNMNDFGQKFKNNSRFNKLPIKEDQTRAQNGSLKNNQARATKIGSFAAYNLNQINESTYLNAINNPKDIAQKIKKLYTSQIVTFINQVSQNSNKQANNKYDSVRKVPEVLKNSSFLTIQDDSQDNIHYQSVLQKPSFLMNNSNVNQSHIGDESLINNLHSQYNIHELRRLSAIARREIMDDNQDVKSYLEEMKSIGQKSPKKKEEQVKITEENEDDQSDSSNSMNSSSLPRKSAISDLTAKSGSPNTGGILHQAYYTSQSDISQGITSTSKRVDMKKNQKLAQNQKLSILQTKPLQSEVLAQSTVADMVQNKKSRLSRQLELTSGLQKQRELTFHKNGQDNDDQSQSSNQNNQAQQIFGLNVNPTSQGRTPRKSIAKIECIEEKEEIQREQQIIERRMTKKLMQSNTKGAPTSHQRQQSYQESESDQSSDNDHQEESVLENDDSNDKNKQDDNTPSNRDTGKFSHHVGRQSKKNSGLKVNQTITQNNTSNSITKSQISSSNLNKHISQSSSKEYRDSITKQSIQDSSPLAKQQSFKTQQSLSNTNNKQGQNQLTPSQDLSQNISQIIAKTIQDQVTQGFQQMMEQVQKLTQSSQQLPQKTPSPPYGKIGMYKHDSSHSRSFASSIYDDDWRAQVHLRQHISGGAASNKKISMEKPKSKEQSTRQSLMRQQVYYQSVRERPQKEETEVDDEDDYVNDPEVDQQIRMKEQPLINLKNLSTDVRRQSITKRQRGQTNDEYSDPQLIQPGQNKNTRSETRISGINSQNNYQSQLHQQLIQGINQQLPFQSLANLQISPVSQQRQQDFSPLNRSNNNMGYSSNQLPFMSPQQPIYAYPMHHQQQQFFPPQNIHHPQMNFYDQNQQFYQQNQIMPHHPLQHQGMFNNQQLYQQRQLMDQELFNFDDQTDGYTPTTYTVNTNNQLFLTDLSQIVNGDVIEQQNQQAIVLEDTQCQLKGDMMQLYEGDIVEVLKIINETGMCECRYNNQVGIFPLVSLKMMKRSVNSTTGHLQQQMKNSMQQQLSTQRIANDQIQNQQRSRGSNISGVSAHHQNQASNEDLSRIFNKRQNFFKQKIMDFQDEGNSLRQTQHQSNNTMQQNRSQLMQQQQLQQQQIHSNNSMSNQTKGSGSNLKMNERKQQRRQRQDKDSAERFIEQLHM